MRYAIYFTPAPTTALSAFGAGVLGYEIDSGRAVPFFESLATRPGWTSLTEAPRRYGFHATLKAPFSLAAGRSEAELVASVRALAASRATVDLGRLVVTAGVSFVSLRPSLAESRPIERIGALAQDCVEKLDRFRAPLSNADRSRRRPELLTPVQHANLEKWGYPFVGDEFRFHMTLTGPVDDDATREAIASQIERIYSEVRESGRVDALSLCRQGDSGQRFQVVDRFPLVATVL